MTLEEIRERRAELAEHELDSDIMEMFCWMIDEIKRLQRMEREAPEVITCAEHRAMLETAKRCAEITLSYASSVNAALAILDEFGLEEQESQCSGHSNIR